MASSRSKVEHNPCEKSRVIMLPSQFAALIQQPSDAMFSVAFANRFLPANTPIAPRKSSPRHPQPKATKSDHAPAACNSPRNANLTVASTQLVRITHPFHPFADRQLVCVGERYNRYGKRLLLRIDDHTICSVPLQWTDIAAVDPDIVIGQARTLLRFVDLLKLAQFVERLAAERRPERPHDCKDKCAAYVKRNKPRGG